MKGRKDKKKPALKPVDWTLLDVNKQEDGGVIATWFKPCLLCDCGNVLDWCGTLRNKYVTAILLSGIRPPVALFTCYYWPSVGELATEPASVALTKSTPIYIHSGSATVFQYHRAANSAIFRRIWCGE